MRLPDQISASSAWQTRAKAGFLIFERKEERDRAIEEQKDRETKQQRDGEKEKQNCQSDKEIE